MIEVLSVIARAKWGADKFFIDDVMRQIPDHCHMHARRRCDAAMLGTCRFVLLFTTSAKNLLFGFELSTRIVVYAFAKF